MENYPTNKWRKQQFVDWLTEKNITFSDKALRAELWTLVKSEREKFPDKVMETEAKEYGHEILRGWQLLTMKAAETLCIVSLRPEKHIS